VDETNLAVYTSIGGSGSLFVGFYYSAAALSAANLYSSAILAASASAACLAYSASAAA